MEIRSSYGCGCQRHHAFCGDRWEGGFDYLVRDPGAGAAKGLYPLRELGSDIEALRFYQPVANASVAVQR